MRARYWGLLALLASALSCGSGDDDSGSGGTGGYGTCDLRTLQETCIEATGSPRSIADQKTGCLDHDGSWSTEPCPSTPELIGCCQYTFGNKFRECFYDGTPQTDPEGYCTDQSIWSDGVWTPAK
jgi:hypothetical protein